MADNINNSLVAAEPINFIDEFENSNINSHWSHEIYIAQEPVCNTIICIIYF